MASRRISGRRLSVSRAAKQLLKERKRKRKLGITEEEPEVSKKVLWILVIAAILVGSLLAWLVVR